MVFIHNGMIFEKKRPYSQRVNKIKALNSLGSFYHGSKLRIAFIEIYHNRQTYIHMLESHLLKQGKNVSSHNCVLQEDNSSILSLKDKKNDLKKKRLSHLIGSQKSALKTLK